MQDVTAPKMLCLLFFKFPVSSWNGSRFPQRSLESVAGFLMERLPVSSEIPRVGRRFPYGTVPGFLMARCPHLYNATQHVDVCKIPQRKKSYVYFFSTIKIFRIRCWLPRSLESVPGFLMERFPVSSEIHRVGRRFPHGTVAGFLKALSQSNVTTLIV